MFSEKYQFAKEIGAKDEFGYFKEISETIGMVTLTEIDAIENAFSKPNYETIRDTKLALPQVSVIYKGLFNRQTLQFDFSELKTDSLKVKTGSRAYAELKIKGLTTSVNEDIIEKLVKLEYYPQIQCVRESDFKKFLRSLLPQHPYPQ